MSDLRRVRPALVGALVLGVGLAIMQGAPWWCTAVVVAGAAISALAWWRQDRAGRRRPGTVTTQPHPALPRPTPPCAPRARVIVPTEDDDDRRPVDVELSAAVHRSMTHAPGRELRLSRDERPGAVDPPWTRRELEAAVSHMRGQVSTVALEPGAGVVEDAARICRRLTDLYPALASDALRPFSHQYCFENR